MSCVAYKKELIMDELEELNKRLRKIQNEQNNQGLSKFEGYSPMEMQYILYDTFGKNSSIQLMELSDADFKKIPLLNQAKYLMQLVDKSGELKLTAKGFLRTKVVADIYNQEFIKEELIESGIYKLYKETDAKSINLTRILLEISGLCKKRHNKLSLTKKGTEAFNDDYKLLKSLIITFSTKFNWAYFDRYGENPIGQLGFGFSLILLNKYGSTKQLDSFYGKKYLKAFPILLNEIDHIGYGTKEKHFFSCYSVRSFDRFLDYFGLIKIDSGLLWSSEKFIKKTQLFDKLIKVRPPIRG